MHRVSEVIVVEGRYDKNTLSQVVDAVIIETSGFGVFNNKEKQQLLRALAEKRGLIVMTDPDGAGLVIRNFVKSCVDPKLLKQAYMPEIFGKERRKSKASKEGKLGVEGMNADVIMQALRCCGATIDGEETHNNGRYVRCGAYGKARQRRKACKIPCVNGASAEDDRTGTLAGSQRAHEPRGLPFTLVLKTVAIYNIL